MNFDDQPVELPVNGELDLHTFHPSDVRDVVEAYLQACRERGILDLRVVHGKGKGVLREQVHALLRNHPAVKGFSIATDRSSWGATVVRLRPVQRE